MAEPAAGGAGGDPVLAALGLAARAGRVAIGTRSVLEAARSGEVRLVLVASDATENAVARVAGAVEELPVLRRGEKVELGRAIGRGPTVVVGVRDRGLAEKMLGLAGREIDGDDVHEHVGYRWRTTESTK